MFVTDTHPLLWYVSREFSQLPLKARRAFEATESGESLIVVPVVVLWEIAILEKLGRIKLSDRFDRWALEITKRQGLRVVPLDIQTIHTAVGYGRHRDPFDNVIVATAVELDMPLITRDAAITESNLVEVYW